MFALELATAVIFRVSWRQRIETADEIKRRIDHMCAGLAAIDPMFEGMLPLESIEIEKETRFEDVPHPVVSEMQTQDWDGILKRSKHEHRHVSRISLGVPKSGDAQFYISMLLNHEPVPFITPFKNIISFSEFPRSLRRASTLKRMMEVQIRAWEPEVADLSFDQMAYTDDDVDISDCRPWMFWFRGDVSLGPDEDWFWKAMKGEPPGAPTDWVAGRLYIWPENAPPV
jgi:hypothetical protein